MKPRRLQRLTISSIDTAGVLLCFVMGIIVAYFRSYFAIRHEGWVFGRISVVCVARMKR